MKRIFYIISFLISIQVYGQQDPQISHYMFLTSFYNPAFAGVNGNISINLLSRNQWIKFKGAPQTQILTVDAPINLFGSQAGIGIKIMNDQYAFVTDKILGFMFSKSLTLLGGNLNFGLGTNLFSKDFNAQWQFPDQTENLFSGKNKSLIIDFDIGMFYSSNNLYLGFSATHILNPNFSFITSNGNQQISLIRHFYLYSGYNFSVPGTLFDLSPSVLIKTDAHIMQFDLNLNVLYNKKIWAGVSYRNGESIIGFIGTSYIKDIKIGVSYDVLLNSIGRVSSGSFEVYIGYNFAILKMEKPQHYHNVKTL